MPCSGSAAGRHRTSGLGGRRFADEVLSISARYRLRPGETPLAFVRRRQRDIKQVLNRKGWWSQLWFKRVRAWDAHLDRHPESPAAKMRSWRGEGWLQSARALWANMRSTRDRPWTLTAGRTDTRVTPGRPQMRWHEGLRFADLGSAHPLEWPLRRQRRQTAAV